MFVFKPVLMLAVFLSGLLVSGITFSQEQSYTQSIETWRQEREARLTSETGWLTIAGLYWLQEGENRIGTDPSNDIVLSASSAPAHIGVFTFQHGATSFQTAKGIRVLHKGKAIQSALLTAGGAVDVISVGALTMWVHKSGERFAIRVRDPDSPLRKKFTGLSWFPSDPTYRVTARFVPYDAPKPAPMINILGDIERFTSPGYVVFELGGQTLRLEPVASEENDLFFVFRDGTSGKETYAATRFLRADTPQNGQVVLDFNKAYNPPCAFNPFTTCPLPPKDNRLAIRIEAGELEYRQEKSE